MKRDKKSLYESIMKNVSKLVKNVLNEDQDEAMELERRNAAATLIKLILDSGYEEDFPEMLNGTEFLNIARMVSSYFMNKYGIPSNEMEKENHLKIINSLISSFRQLDFSNRQFMKLPCPQNVNKNFFKILQQNLTDENIPVDTAAREVVRSGKRYNMSSENIMDLTRELVMYTALNLINRA